MSEDLDKLRAENEALKAALANQGQVISKLKHYLRGLLRGRYGRATEKLLGIRPQEQQLIAEITAFLEDERQQEVVQPIVAAESVTASPAVAAQPSSSSTQPSESPCSTPKKSIPQRGQRQRPSVAFPNLEVRTHTQDVSEFERIDGDGKPMVACGEQIVETVVFKEPEVYIDRTIYPRYRSSETSTAEGSCATAGVPVPERITERGSLADVTVQQIVIGKFADAVPGNRTLEIMARAGCRLSGSVVDRAVADMGDLLLPMSAAIRADLQTAAVVGVDAAIMRCRDPELRRTCRRTPIYTVTDGTQAWYHWAPDETHAHAPDVVAGLHCWMITDAWSGWRKSTSIGARLAGCWAHARRPFARIEERDPDAANMVHLVHELYEIESQADAAEATLAERGRLRDVLTRPIVNRIRIFAQTLSRKHPGASGHPCGQGSRYILNQWFELVKFLDHPMLRLDNNLAEGDLRMVALIRKNSLFLGAESAGPRAAACLSVVRSCRLARINPGDYLTSVVPKLITWRRLRRANFPTPDLADLTPKRWAATNRETIRQAC